MKSGKYLTSIPDLLAKIERENIRIILDTHGTSASYLKVLPRYKIDREGDRVLSNSEIYLVQAERTNEYIHRAEKDPFPGSDREVNSSLELTSWHLNIFQSSMDSMDKSILLANQLVYINDPETRSNLTIALTSTESLDEPPPLQRPELHSSEREFAHDFGDIVLEPTPQDFMNSNILWFIELATAAGGPIQLKSDKVRFKHMNTGLYLKLDFVDRAASSEDIDEIGEECCIFTTTKSNVDPNTLFSLTEINSIGEVLLNAKAIQIACNSVYIERSDVLDSGSFIVKGTTL